MTVILTAQGVTRVLDGQKGMTFIVDRVSLDRDKRATVMHVRDYRFPRHGAPGLSYQIWTLGEGDYIEAGDDMRVGCFTLDLYCEHPDHVSKHGFQFQFTGETRAECIRQAKKLGWDLSNETEICPRHSGKKKNLPEKIP